MISVFVWIWFFFCGFFVVNIVCIFIIVIFVFNKKKELYKILLFRKVIKIDVIFFEYNDSLIRLFRGFGEIFY